MHCILKANIHYQTFKNTQRKKRIDFGINLLMYSILYDHHSLVWYYTLQANNQCIYSGLCRISFFENCCWQTRIAQSISPFLIRIINSNTIMSLMRSHIIISFACLFVASDTMKLQSILKRCKKSTTILRDQRPLVRLYCFVVVDDDFRLMDMPSRTIWNSACSYWLISKRSTWNILTNTTSSEQDNSVLYMIWNRLLFDRRRDFRIIPLFLLIQWSLSKNSRRSKRFMAEFTIRPWTLLWTSNWKKHLLLVLCVVNKALFVEWKDIIIRCHYNNTDRCHTSQCSNRWY